MGYQNTEVNEVQKNNTGYTSKQLKKMWKDCSVGGEFHRAFLKRQMTKNGIFIPMTFEWLGLLNRGKSLVHINTLTAEQIVHRYELAKWLASDESDEVLVRHKCSVCNNVSYYIEDKHHKYYMDFIIAKNKCHTITTKEPIGYGSKLDTFDLEDGETGIEIGLCDYCLYKMVEQKESR
jgi:hypothetical protein